MTPALDIRYWGFFVLGLLSLLLFMGGVGLWWNSRQRTLARHRLPGWTRAHSNSIVRADASSRWLSTSPRLAQWLAQVPGIERYDRFLQQTGWPVSSAQAVVGSLALAIGVLVLATLTRTPWPMALLVSLTALVAGQATLLWRRQHRATALERQLPEALALVARSMQAGHAFSSALQIAGQESPNPMGAELRAVFSEIQYGESANEALAHWAERVAGQDIRIFVIAVRIQSETGGNLAELLHQTAALIRERQKLRGVVRVLSAEGRISALILTLLPFGLAGMLSVLNPEFMAQLWTDPLGIRMLTVALVLMGIGVLWMWRLARIQP